MYNIKSMQSRSSKTCYRQILKINVIDYDKSDNVYLQFRKNFCLDENNKLFDSKLRSIHIIPN